MFINVLPALSVYQGVVIQLFIQAVDEFQLGNHDARGAYKDLLDEVYAGPLFIADKILLSHEPVYGLSWCLNIHGHDHNNVEKYREDCKHINLAANVCGFTPVNLGRFLVIMMFQF